MNAEFMRMLAPSGHSLFGRHIPELSPPQQMALLKELLGGLVRSLLPAPPQEITVNAELLYNYIGVYAIPPQDYVKSLKASSGVFDSLKRRLFKGVDGQPALNIALGLDVAGPSFKRFPGAVVVLTLFEAMRLGEERQPEFIDRELRRWAPLAVAGGASARYLHHYLGVNEDYDAWIAGHKKRCGMKRNLDFFVVPGLAGGRSSEDVPTMSSEELVVTWAKASEIVKVEQTPKAAQIIALWKGGP
jgi:hypothetical protein